MKKIPLMTALMLCLFTGFALFSTQAFSQTTITSAYVLGCTNPAPAAAGKPTVFFDKCTTTAFVPTTTSSVIASVSKTGPMWAHSYSWYLTHDPTVSLVACPIGATVNAATCMYNGADVSALVLQKNLAIFKVTPPPAPKLGTFTLTWTPPTTNTDTSAIAAGTLSYSIQHGSALTGPWDPAIASTQPTYSYKGLPVTVQQCFQVAAVETVSGVATTSTYLPICAPANSVPAAPSIPGGVQGLKVTIDATTP